jgi:hypothetical protein
MLISRWLIRYTDSCLGDNVKNGFMVLRGKLRRLPGVHQATVRIVVEHLARVAARAQKNKWVLLISVGLRT